MSKLNRVALLGRASVDSLERTLIAGLRRHKRPVHVLFCTTDHYEPGTGRVSEEIERQRVSQLLEEYPRLVASHCDADGMRPKRTWFYPPHYHRYDALRQLAGLCKAGYGEIELHLHHGKTRPDTPENLQRTIECCLDEYSRFGIFGREAGRIRYGFIHGDWALCNSRGGRFCGVNNEIEILVRTGCYADFTFPSGNEANPLQINSIYYAPEDVAAPGAHRRGRLARSGAGPQTGLMMIQGPLHPFSKNGRLSGVRAFGDVVDGNVPVTPERVDAWVRTGIHVAGKPEWIVVKTHTHGATDADAVLGPEMDGIFSHLENRYNDGENFVLHYVTARELYNILRAVEDGAPGNDPGAYRDYLISAPAYDDSPPISEASEQLQSLVGYSYGPLSKAGGCRDEPCPSK